MIKYVGIWALQSSVGWGITFTHYLVLAELALAARARQTMSGRILRLLFQAFADGGHMLTVARK